MSTAELRQELAELESRLRQLDADLGGEPPVSDKTLAALERKCEEQQKALAAAQAELDEDEDRRAKRLQQMVVQLERLEGIASREAEREGKQRKAPPAECAAQLEAVATHREDDLSSLHAQLSRMQKEDADVTQALMELKDRAALYIPEMEKQKDDLFTNIATAWQREKYDLTEEYKHAVLVKHELFWHLKRGTHIKQVFVDPRNPADAFENRAHDTHDEHLHKLDKLVGHHLAQQAHSTQLDHEKVQSERSRRDQERQWEAAPVSVGGKVAMSKEGLFKYPEGSKPWYEQQIGLVKAQLFREQRTTNELTDNLAFLRSVKAGMGDVTKRLSRQYESALRDHSLEVESHRKALRDRKHRQIREAGVIRPRIAKASARDAGLENAWALRLQQ
eukprot:TRINITY_DN3309_c0_g1_i1.p1 TRINITY_DN3309_c0_g1~~TRINITY_DN3309_c0_g1_i1.p1  ORF type:complete len:422 (+),score=205.05 TRINITY_DN3309_c0_g1_i1:96-1268(+)